MDGKTVGGETERHSLGFILLDFSEIMRMSRRLERGMRESSVEVPRGRRTLPSLISDVTSSSPVTIYRCK